jgi:glutathione S-transferase
MMLLSKRLAAFLYISSLLLSLLSIVQIADSFTLMTMMSLKSTSSSGGGMMKKNKQKSKPQPPSSSSILFVTNKMCPFAQKVWIALEAADVSYKLEQVSLYGPGGKPDWFWELNPKGQVPILKIINNNYNNNIDNNIIIADSDQILDEIGMVMTASSSKTSVELLVVHSDDDDDDDDDAAAKINTFRSKLDEFLPVGKDAVLGGGDKQRMWNKLKEIDNLLGEEGPYILNDKLTIADCAAFPFLWRINEEFSKGSSCAWKDNGCEKIPIWLDYCSKQPPFADSIQSSWWWWW